MYEINGNQYSVEDLQQAAQQFGMSFEEYMQKMQAKGLTEIQEQTTDENFQQDGVAGADAPSVIAAPTDTESQPDLGFLDLQDPVQPTPAPFRPEALTEEEKADEIETRSRLKTNSSMSTSLNLIKGLNNSDIDWVQFNKNDASYNEQFLGENNYDDTLKQLKNLYLGESGLSEYDFEQLYADKVQELAENKSLNDLAKQDKTLKQTLASRGIDFTDDDKFSYQRKIEDEKETSFDKKFLDILAKEKQIVNSLKTANPEEKAKLAVELTNVTSELDRIRGEKIQTPGFIDLFKKNGLTAASKYLAYKIIKSQSITGNVVEDMFDLDGNPIKHKTSDKKSINSDNLLQATKQIELDESLSGMSKQEYYETLDKSNLINLYDSNILGSAKVRVNATSDRAFNYLKSLGLNPVEQEKNEMIATKEGGVSATFEPTVLDLAKIKNKAFLNDLNLIQNWKDFYDEAVLGITKDTKGIMVSDDRFKDTTDLYSFIDTYSSQRADIISKNKALRILSRFDVDPTTINDAGFDTAIDLVKTAQKAFDKSNFEVVNSVSSNTEAKEELFNFLENNKESIGDFKISDNFVEELKPSTFYKNGVKQVIGFTPDLIEFGFVGRNLKSLDKIAKISKTINKIKTTSKTGNFLKKSALFGLAAAKEEYKMRTVFDENYHLGGGTAFVGVGALANKIPALTPFNILNRTLQIPKSGVVFATASEAAQFFEGGIESVSGGKTFQRHLQETYGDYDEVQQRLIGNMVFGSMLHVQSSTGKAIENLAQGKRNFEWMSTAKLDNLNVASQSKLNAATRLYRSELANSLSQGKSAKEFNESNLGKSLIENINKHGSIFAGTTAVLSKMRGEQDLKSGDVNRVESYYKKKHSKNIQNWRNIAGEKANIVYDKSGDRSNFKTEGIAELDADGVTIRVDLKRVADRGLEADPGLISHEINHRLTVDAFKKNPQAKTELFNQLKSEFPEVLSRIKEAYKEELAAGTANLEDEYLSFFVQTLANKSNYNLFSAKLQGKNASSTWTRLVDYTNRWSRKRSGWTPFENGSEASKESIIRYYADLALGLKEGRTTDADISILNKIGKTGFKENIQVTEPVISTEAKQAFAGKDLNQLQKESSKVQEIYEGSRKQKPGETIEAYTDRLIEQANRLDRINELDSKGKDRTPEETAERRALKTQNSNKIIPKYNQYVDILVNKKYKSADEQAYTKEDFKSDLNIQILELMNTYQPSTGVEFNYYVYDNLPKRIPGILEGKVAKEFTKELSDASNKTIDAEITENIDANNKIQKEAVKAVIDPVKELGTKGFEIIETENADGTIKQERVQKEVLNLDKVTTLEEVTTKTYRGVKEQIGGRVAKEFFGIDPQKATDIKHDKDGRPVRDNKGKLVRVSANLTSEGFGSEARKIQDIIQDYSKFKRLMKIINPKNVSSEVAELTPPGETVARKIDVSRDTYGIATGIKNNMLNLFMNKTGVRSKGQTSQVEVRELKPELLNITPELHKSFIRNNFGVTGKGEANIYNKAVGQNLKGFIDMISGSIANKYYRDKIIREQGGFANNEQLLADIAAGKPVTMASKSILDRAFKQFDLTEVEREKIYKSTNPNIFQTKDPILFEKYQDVLAFSRKQASDLAELNNIKIFNEAGIINNKIINKDKFITGEDSSRVDHHIVIKDAKNNDLNIGIEAKAMGGPTGARYGQFTIKPEFNSTTREAVNVKIDPSRPQLTGKPKENLLKQLTDYAKLVRKASNGKEEYNKHRAKISESTKDKLDKFKKQFKTIEGNINDIINSYVLKEKDGHKGDFAFMTQKDGSIDVYSFGPDKYNIGAEPLNGTPKLETRIRIKSDGGDFTINLIAEYRLTQDGIKNKTKLNIKNAQELVDKFVNPISKNSFASKNINSLTSSDIMKEIEAADKFNMRDVISNRLFSKQLKNKPSFMQGFGGLNEKQQQAVLKEMAKSNLTTSKFNNRLLPESERLTGEFTNEQVLEKIKELDIANDNSFVMASKDLNVDFNKIIERSTKGKISAERVLSQTEAIMEGASKGRFDIFIRPAAEDFVGLLYKTLGKGKQGDADMAFYKKNLLDPFAKAMANISADRISLLNDYKFLVRNLRVPGERGVKGLLKTPPLKRKVGDTGFTTEQAVRAYVWTKQGMEIPGLSESQLKKLLLHVKENKELITFGNQLININKGDGYIKPSNNWLSGSIGTDILQGLNTTKRSKYLEAWQKNVDVIFSAENLNKLQAAYGKPYVDAMKNMLTRMKTGRNRVFSGDTITTKFTDFIAQATGSIMFLNSRSAVLQTISSLNFINFGDNNIFAAGKAFANQKQYWKDFSKLYNSDFLKDRRSGLRINVIEADISAAARRGGISGVTARLLELGFTPTQIADSFAISAGGSTFYRNRIKTYEKETDVDGNKIYTKEQAEQKAFQDFRETAEESQQSSRPDKISQEQAGGLGRHVLAFANTPAQYARIIKKSALDLKNGRGDAKTNISKIVYYTFAQNVIFNTLQQAIFATAFDDDLKVTEDKAINLANGMSNSLIRGMGVYPAVGAAIKDAAIKIYTEKQKKKPEFEKAAIQLLNIAPPLGSKYRKIAGGLKTYDFTTVDAAIEKGVSLDNPAIRGAARVTEGLTNLPLDRLLIKLDNIQGALDQDNENWQRVGMGLGWQDWQLGIKDEKEKKKATGGFKPKKYKIKTYKLK